MTNNNRRREVRSKMEKLVGLSKCDRELILLEGRSARGHWRPKTRGDCVNSSRPCPYVGCRHHLYLEVNKNGNILYNFPDLEPGDMACSCALDVADRGASTLDDVGHTINLTRERARQVCESIMTRPEVKELFDENC